MPRRVLVIGLDCAPAQWVLETWKEELPALRSLREAGISGPLQSCDPPITVPAWMCFSCGRNPGALGLYGFRNRRSFSYPPLTLASSRDVGVPPVWEIAGKAGRTSVVIGVPPSYPPRAFPGCELVSCFLAPDTESACTHPPALAEEIRKVVGTYEADVAFRTEDRDTMLRDLYRMTERRWELAEHLIKTRDWDLFFLMEIGTDRIQHAFWKYLDPTHPRHEPDTRYARAILDYYRFLDDRIGQLLQAIDDSTSVLIVSDHGAKSMRGAINVNDWLRENDYLKLHSPVARPSRLESVEVDWANTRAWAAGGYYARIFLNLQGREPMGIVRPQQRGETLDELEQGLRSLPDDHGNPMATRVLRPEHLYTGEWVPLRPRSVGLF